MEAYKPDTEMSPQRKLEAYFRGIMNQVFSKGKTLQDARFNPLTTHIIEFTNKVEQESPDLAKGSVALHMLKGGSTVKPEDILTPDPLFSTVKDFLENELSRIPLPHIEEDL